MGVRGLTTFIARDSKRYLKPIKLKNSYLVIDGNCISSHLYKWCTKRDSAFGGDYDDYYITVHKFFLTLKKCQITPVIIFDGGYENKKVKTVIKRLKDKLMTLKTTFAKGFHSGKFFPLFMKDVFCEAAASFDITIIQCELEADSVIAGIARQLNCPVLSYDSDFFIFDVLYIPFSTIELDLSTSSGSNDGLSCSLYKLDNFLEEYPGLKKNHFPLICTLLGNDFVPSHVFFSFFKQIPLSRVKDSTNLDKRILGLFNWLRYESEASALKKIQSLVGKSKFELFQNSLKVSKESYKLNDDFKVEIINDKLNIIPPPYSLPLDKVFIGLLVSCGLPSLIINMILLHRYFLPLQIEDLNSFSAHEVALPLISKIYKLICSSTKDTEDLIIFLRQGKHIKQRTVSIEIEEEMVDLNKVIKWPQETRIDLIFNFFKMDDDDKKCIAMFPKDCRLFICCFIFWSKFAKPFVEHMHSVLFGFLGSQSKNRAGPCRVGQTWSINIDQHVTFTSVLARFRKTMEQEKIKYSCSIVHPFSQFQSIVYHSSIINTLLGRPLNPCKISDCFNGTLCFNLYVKFLNESHIVDSLNTLLDSAKNIFELYSSYFDILNRYFSSSPRAAQTSKLRKRRKKHKPIVSVDLIQDAEVQDSDDSSNDYADVNNKFYALKI